MLRSTSLPTLILTVILSLVMAASGTAFAQSVAFVDVNVLPMDSERVLENQTVIVREGRITEIGPESEVDVAGVDQVVSASGQYLMPGLAEMHAHIPGPDDPQYVEDVLFLYVAHGVTTIRGMAGHPSHLALRDRVATGDLTGPTIYAAGPGFSRNAAGDAAAASAYVEEQHDAGYDLLKIFDISPEAYASMASTASSRGIPFAGHVPAEVGLEGALDAGQRSIDHFDRYAEFLVPPGTDLEGRSSGFFGSGIVDLIDESRIDEAVARTVAAGTWNVPTLSLVEHLASPEPAESMIAWPEMRYMPRGVRDRWVQAKNDFSAREDFQPDASARLVEVRRSLLKALHDEGAMIALGSDAPQFFNVPGFSIHREMQMMVDAGLTPYEVLVTGTRNPALYFDLPDAGTVAVGNRADLILMTANPLEQIGNAHEISGVMVGGRFLPRTEIEARLDAIAQRNAP